MNTTIKADATTRGQTAAGNWVTRGAVTAGRGMVLFGFTLASLGLWAALLIAAALIPLGVGLPLTAVSLRAVGGLAARAWLRLAGWGEFAAAADHSAGSEDELTWLSTGSSRGFGRALAGPELAGIGGQQERQPGFWERFGFLIADPVTWRSLLWSTIDILAGWLLTLTPAGLIAWGLFGVVMPAVWHPIVAAHGNNWYAFIHVTTASTAWLSVALGIAFIALGLLTAPWLVRRYAALVRRLLAPA